MIDYIEKDIITVVRGIVAHGVNCQGVMNSGVAKAIRNKWPVVYDTYRRIPKGKGNLGICNLVTIVDNELFVANCYTQIFYGYGGRFASPKAIKSALDSVYMWADHYVLPVYLPKIGAGRGGLDWEKEVFPIVEGCSNKTDNQIQTYICEWKE